MSWSQDQRPTHAHALAASASPESSTHSAKSRMDRRWEQRRAAANARWAEVTSSVVLERADVSGVQPTEAAVARIPSAPPTDDLLLEDMRQLELKDQSKSSAAYAIAPSGIGPMWLRDTQRAMLLVAAFSCSTLLALLYFGGFLG